MKRAIQLFHEVSGAREYAVADESVTVKDFVFSIVEELQNQDKEFFEVYDADGSRISDRKVVDAQSPYIVVCDIISARTEEADCWRQAVRFSKGFHGRLRSFLDSFDTVETCGLLVGVWDGGRPEYLLGVFPNLDVQTRNDAVVSSQDVALILLGMRNATEGSARLALAWVHTHLDTPPRLSAKDRRTLARLRSLAPETCAMIFNRHFPDVGIVSYLSDGVRVPLLEVNSDVANRDKVASIRDAILRTYAACNKTPPSFVA